MQRFKNMVFITDSRSNDPSILRAVEIAKRNGATLTLLDAVEKLPTWAGEPSEQIDWDKIYAADIERRKDILKETARPFKDVINIKTKVLEGKKVIQIIREVLAHSHDLVIKPATHPKNFIRRVFASEDMQLLRKCPCPVLLINSEKQNNFKTIMAAIDFDENNGAEPSSANMSLNDQILDMSISLAALQNSRLDIIHSVEGISETMQGGITGLTEDEFSKYIDDLHKDKMAMIEKSLTQAKRRLGRELYGAVEIKPHLVKGDPKTIIPKQAKALGTDLIVMGTVARTGIAGFIMGNTAETILHNIECSVLAVKPDGFVSPVTAV